MASLHTILKFGYFLMIFTLLLMMWVSWLEAVELDNTNEHPPCYFNPFCTCSKTIPADMGIVQCRNVPLPRIPPSLNSSKVYSLQLENNGLKWFEPYFLHGTGLYRLEISHNPLGEIPEGIFMGLERYLWEVHLKYDQLVTVPTNALKFLQKLRLLDLTGNDISMLEPDDWRGLENTLQILILADNSISQLSSDTFSGLPLLDTIDLRSNNLKFIDPNVFRDGLGHLTKVLFGDNQLIEIPYLALAPLHNLRYLDLSKNFISAIFPDEPMEAITPLALDTIRLDYNIITVLHPGSFHLFSVVNNTFLDGNPITALQDNAFRNAKIRDLSLRNCKLTEILPAAFDGLETSLQSLDLSGNNISGISSEMFLHFKTLQQLSFRENVLTNVNLTEVLNGFQYSLLHLDLSGKDNQGIKFDDLKRLRNLRSLKLSRLPQSQLSSDDFLEFDANLEELHITDSNLNTIKNNAFMFIRGLKYLDLSENSIQTLEPECFVDIGHSLISLNLGHGLAKSFQNFPFEALRPLINLQYLNFENNHLTTLPDTAFHFLRRLKRIELQDNKIDQLHKGSFQGDIHSDIEQIFLSFNFIHTLQQHTFVDLNNLRDLFLDDNKIDTINRRAFMNLDKLKYITLRGNKIVTIADEAFQNLPELELLDLAYNDLTRFDFAIFDQVGTLSNFKVNASHNKIKELHSNISNFGMTRSANYHSFFMGSIAHSNIKSLDLSFNNITSISRGYFRPAEISLTHLHLSHNRLTNTSRDMFGTIPNLQWLDLSHNHIELISPDTFRNSKKIQALLFSKNKLETIHIDSFQGMHDLRVLNLSNNFIRDLPDHLLTEGNLEKLDLSNNMLTKLPLTSLTLIAANNLCELDVSGNNIGNVAYKTLFQRFHNLLRLDLSRNSIHRIESAAFSNLPRLISLDLSHNDELDLDDDGLVFRGLEHSLLELKLDNISLTSVPDFPFYYLRSLSIAGNELPTIPPEIAANMSSLRHLDLSFNDLTAIPLVMHSLPQLRILSMAGNPITTLTNTSLLGITDNIRELDLRNLALTTFETGSFTRMKSLEKLYISIQKPLINLNLPKLLQSAQALRSLHIEIEDDTNLQSELLGELPSKLSQLIIVGNTQSLSNSIFEGIQSPKLDVTLIYTKMQRIDAGLFRNLDSVRNISLTIKNSGSIAHIDNPSTGDKPNLPRKTFLTSLKMSGIGYKCDCQIGWIEVWERKKRQYLCNDETTKTEIINCRLASDDFRHITCSDKSNKSLIEVLKSDIECGWGSVGTFQILSAPFLILLSIILQIF